MSAKSIIPYFAAILGVAVVVMLYLPLHELVKGKPGTVAFTQIIIILLVASTWGIGPAVLASIVAVLAFEYLFLPPYYSLSASKLNAEDALLLGAFLVTSVVVGQISANARHRERLAESGRQEFERLYAEQKQENAERTRIERELRENEERFRHLAEMSSDWYWEQDQHFRFTALSGAVLEKSGLRPDSLIGKLRSETPIQMGEEQWASHQSALDARRAFSDLEYYVLSENGRIRWYSISGEPVFDAHGAFLGYRGTGQDITERKRAEAMRLGQGLVLELIATHTSLEEVLIALTRLIESQSDGMIASVVLLDDDGVHLRHAAAPNLPLEYINAIDGAEIGPHAGSCGTAMYRRERVIVTDIQQDPLWHGYRQFAQRHGLRACWSTPVLSRDDKVLGSFAMYYTEVRSPTAAELQLTDLAARVAGIAIDHKRAEERIRHMAHHDALTDLPNRVLFQDRVGQAIAYAHRAQEQVALLMLDLDHFKDINDTLGHPAGDTLLRTAGTRLKGCLREGDSVARLGGDEFGICLPALKDARDAMPVAEKILNAMRLLFVSDGQEIHISGSIGISVYPTDGTETDVLMRNADAALYHAKGHGRDNFQYFRKALNDAAHERLLTAQRLRDALQRAEFVLHYQPQIDLATGKIFSVEALLRWRQPDASVISGGPFIKVAEETGMIVPLGEWVLREACLQLKRWHDAGHPDLRVAVNVSPRQFRSPGFHDFVMNTLEEACVPATALELEITEGVLMLQSSENIAAVQRLADMGVRLAVDDFGTGYSSLTYLQRFPIHTLKIDQSFMSGIGVDQNAMAIVTTIIAMAQNLRLAATAEGVETAEQFEFLKAHRCPFAQGFFFSKALPADQLCILLLEQGP